MFKAEEKKRSHLFSGTKKVQFHGGWPKTKAFKAAERSHFLSEPFLLEGNRGPFHGEPTWLDNCK